MEQGKGSGEVGPLAFFRKEGKEKWKSFVLVNRTRTWFSTENAPPFRCEISSSSDDAGVVN